MSALDVIVRFHDLGRLAELDRAIFSLVAQCYRPLRIILITQRFDASGLIEVGRRLAPILAIDPDIQLTTSNWVEAVPMDGRTMLLNVGLKKASGRFLAFLDFDDAIWPDAYSDLIERLDKTKAAIAFGAICVKQREIFDEALIVTSRRLPFRGRGLVDLFRQNFCPLHSFVIDKNVVLPSDLQFNEEMARMEDYECLLRLCAKYRSNFDLIGTVVGDYYRANFSAEVPYHGPEWEKAKRQIEAIKTKTLVAPEVLQSLGFFGVGEVSIAGLLRMSRRNKVSLRRVPQV